MRATSSCATEPASLARCENREQRGCSWCKCIQKTLEQQACDVKTKTLQCGRRLTVNPESPRSPYFRTRKTTAKDYGGDDRCKERSSCQI
ncbi:hypothetical protein F2P81_009414 [Scophthalmus maximus]|uniref:Uncharacterized protein n=1 Tax=Scophthalmus maximus TaxID=52904 RepID=A0A6A4T4J0_SCOMX|nr:hypothetical protein F2P81_009414 [Scophthalmus maximus]